ncbi:MAG: hypothetical protein IT287_03860 [Bdellovibrionaceae bacterium]|nr:hypothetical protein [Pseudobdellovibrionaceae bacterium]
MNSLMMTVLSIFLMPLSVQAISVDLGLGYSMLELSNPNSSKARSNGLGGTLGAYYSLLSNDNYDFGLKGSVFYSQLDNDINTAVLSEETEYYNVGLGLELAVYDFFASWQYKYNRIEIELSGNMNNTSAFSDYMSQVELGYIFRMEAMSVRLVYQRTDGTLPMVDTGLSSDTDFTSNAFLVVLRFDLSPKPKVSDNDYGYGRAQSEESSSKDTEPTTAPSYRSYRYAPRPSSRIK